MVEGRVHSRWDFGHREAVSFLMYHMCSPSLKSAPCRLVEEVA
jgi:hypothetical protein